ncbi:hypothetical protein BBP40_011081 [Aspergillus hancockii]|nr:hypothetical protein BBP40_011081 [Aspergillus hancockii]
MADEQSPLLGAGEAQTHGTVYITKILAGLVGVFLASADKSVLGVVETLWPFVLGRFIAGIGGAGMTDLLSVLVNETFSITQIASVRSYIIAAGILGQGCGGPLGGLVADMIGWRWSLIGQTPVGLLCLALAHWQLPASAQTTHFDSQLSFRSFDYLGIGAFFILVTSFILGTTEGGISFLSSRTPELLAVSCAFLVVFFIIERFWTKHPIIPPSIIRAPGLGGIFFGQILFFASIMTILNNLPPYFSQIDHLSNSAIAMRIWPSAIGLILGSVIAGKAMSKTLKYRKLSLGAVVIILTSQSLMVVRWANGIHGAEVFYCFPWAVGCGLLLSAQYIALTLHSPTAQLASATAVYYLSQQVGQIIGTSVSATALQHLFRFRVHIGLSEIPLPQRIRLIEHILKDYNFTATLPPAIQAAVQSSYIEAYRLIPGMSMSALTLSAIVGAIVLFPKEKGIKS